MVPDTEVQVPSEIYVQFSATICDEKVDELLSLLANAANQGIRRVVLCLATEGGAIVSGIRLFTMLRAMPIELITHAIGDVASAGNIVFVAGKRRVASQHARFMFHEPSAAPNGQAMNVKELRELAAQLESNSERNRAILEDRTKLTGREIDALKRRTRTVDPEHAVSVGIAHRVSELQVPAGVPLLMVTA